MLLSSALKGGRRPPWEKGSKPGMPPGREVIPKGEGKGSSPSCEELSRNPFAKGFDSIFSFVIWKG